MNALQQVDGEVIVVDNASTDGSREYFASRFPAVGFIWNQENVGFAKANNQAIKLAKGDHVLFLNPDTIVGEDCFEKCLAFFDGHQQAGALGVPMFDGSGKFLKESKRAYPSLLTSFFKLTGLSSLFPYSPVFGKYHLGHLDQGKDHDVDVLAGAFIMVRKEVLEKTGGFDERFFMYGEDIDLSFRIQKAGWRNYYFAGTSIIHFKGESTKRGSLNYVRMFYRAMSVFVQKHYTSLTAFFFRFFINIAIWVRAAVSAVSGFVRKIGLPMVDAVNILVSFIAAKLTWNIFVKPDIIYDQGLLSVAFPAFTVIFITAAYYAGLYDKHQKRGRVIHSALIAVISLLVIYALLPEKYRFSRGILLLGSLYSFILLSLNRLLLRKWNWIEVEDEEKMGTVIAGSVEEYHKVIAIMEEADKEERILGRIAIADDVEPHISTVDKLPALFQELPLREIIFCQGILSFSSIISYSKNLPVGVRMRVMAQGSGAIVGSDSSKKLGEAVSKDSGSVIGLPSPRRLKRLLDMAASLVAILGFPIHVFFVKRPVGLLKNAAKVMAGSMSWVGYSSMSSGLNGLPKIRKGVLGANGMPPLAHTGTEEGHYLIDKLYADNYSVYKDLHLLSKGYKWLGT